MDDRATESEKEFKDVSYVEHVNFWTSALVRRVESLNSVSNMIWLDDKTIDSRDFPLSRYDWLSFYVDAFLMRFTSIIDGLLILISVVFELDVPEEKCFPNNLIKAGAPTSILTIVEKAQAQFKSIKNERNKRFHHTIERAFSSDDTTFRITAAFEHWGKPMLGTDRHGLVVNTKRYMRESLTELQGEFNQSAKRLSDVLDDAYELILPEFESRFHLKYWDPEFGYGHRIRKTPSAY